VKLAIEDHDGVRAVEEADALRVALVRIHRQLRVRSGKGMTPSQASALSRIEQGGSMRLGTLAELEGTTAATMSRVIDGLAAASLIERVPDPLDGRASLLQLSPEGGALLHDLRSRYTEALRGAISALGADDRAAIHRAIPVLEQLSGLLQSGDRDESAAPV
jgi:DNA-binding MarR family transcriptional regulator